MCWLAGLPPAANPGGYDPLRSARREDPLEARDVRPARGVARHQLDVAGPACAEVQLHGTRELLLRPDPPAHDGVVGTQVLQDREPNGVHRHAVVAHDHDVPVLQLAVRGATVSEGGDPVEHYELWPVAGIEL